ncbi:2-oxo acid dehydrogenase subunit E2 [Halorubraceae archaeon YAN]|nr:2-oxo acid dehydrogenase subunit E2 [Halorubraceae archaeon YAN]
MAYVVKIPKLGLEMDSGTVVAWLVEEGGTVTKDEPIAEIESEKTTAEVDAREDGVLREIILQEGDNAPPGDPMAIVAGEDEDISELLASIGTDEPAAPEPETKTTDAPAAETTATAQSQTTSVKASPRAKKRAEELGVDLTTVSGSGPGGAITEEDVESAGPTPTEDIKASPRAKKRAEELGVDLATVSGSGPGGAITEEDVESHTDATTTTSDGRTIAEERPLDGMRRTISSRLGESYRNAVHVTEHRTAGAAELKRAANAATAVTGEKVSVTDILLTTLSEALGEHPEFNATFEDDVHYLYNERNICLAVDVDDGLITPVIRNVDELSIDELATKRGQMTEKALSGSYSMDDLTGGTFTVSNLGLLGVESFDPIINPPQVAILGVNAMGDRPVAQDGAVAIKTVLPLDLSFDHRVVDGADAARFLTTLVGHIENPWPLLDGVSPSDAPTSTETASTTPVESEDKALPHQQATATLTSDLSGTIDAGDYAWPFDVTPEFGGGRHPTPVDYFTGALSACLSASIGIQAEMRDVSFDTVEVNSTSAPEGGSVESIEIDITLKGVSETDTSTIDRIVTAGERTCHIAELLRDDVDVSLDWTTD